MATKTLLKEMPRIEEKTVTLTGKETTMARRQLAHRMLDAILSAGGKIGEDYCPNADDSFGKVLHAHYHWAMHWKMQQEGRLIDQISDEAYTGPRFTVVLVNDQDPGVIVKPQDFTIFDKGRILSTAARDGRVVGYEVERGRNGWHQWLTLAVYFGYRHTGAESWHDDQPWWYRQSIEINPSMDRFRCPLCGDGVSELFVTGDPSAWAEHFGCVSCSATLDPKQAKLYLKARGPKPIRPLKAKQSKELGYAR